MRGTAQVKAHVRLVANRPIAIHSQITVSYSSFFPLTTGENSNADSASASDSAGVGSGAGGGGGGGSGSGGSATSAGAAMDATRSVVPFPMHGYSNTQLLVHFGLALPINGLS